MTENPRNRIFLATFVSLEDLDKLISQSFHFLIFWDR